MTASFDFDFNFEMFTAMLPTLKNPDDWFESVCEEFAEHEVTTPLRVAAFMAQTAHESNDWNTLVENLNYSAQGLANTWPKRFSYQGRPNNLALSIARKPELIANNVYANRYGNGSVESGDGWKYRGRCIIQCTFKDNYEEASYSIFGDDTLVLDPDRVLDPSTTLKVALWYWSKHDLNYMADKQDIKGIRRVINGGYIGLDKCVELYNRNLDILESQ